MAQCWISGSGELAGARSPAASLTNWAANGRQVSSSVGVRLDEPVVRQVAGPRELGGVRVVRRPAPRPARWWSRCGTGARTHCGRPGTPGSGRASTDARSAALAAARSTMSEWNCMTSGMNGRSANRGSFQPTSRLATSSGPTSGPSGAGRDTAAGGDREQLRAEADRKGRQLLVVASARSRGRRRATGGRGRRRRPCARRGRPARRSRRCRREAVGRTRSSSAPAVGEPVPRADRWDLARRAG